ncbi:hypothetical protein KAU11_08890 [Candidatus Babeliales bacterium]|nr:hypothetical protein [Candidatus Babeliales bacterium]
MRVFLAIGLYLYKAKGLSQAMLILLTASFTIPFIDTIEKFILPRSLDNWVIFLILLILDVASGLYKHSGVWKKTQPNTLNKDEFFLKLFKKVFIGAVWLVLINVIINLDNSSNYFDSFGIGALISWLGWSIASNLYVISDSTFPPKWVMNRLQKANEGESSFKN